jgi:Fe-S-cluster containining protein
MNYNPSRDAELLRILDQGFAHSAEVAGEHLVCRPGCTQCCHGAFRINTLDAARLRAGMSELRATNPTLAATLAARATQWLADHAQDYPGNAHTGILGTTEEEQVAFDGFVPDAPCPALDSQTGLCNIYAWRPMTCRIFGPPVQVDAAEYGETETDAPAFAHCELCFTNATEDEIRASELIVPHELEAELISDQSETIVAFALLK